MQRNHSDLPLNEPVEAHLDNLLSKLEKHADRVKQASTQFSLGIQVIDRDHHMQKLHLSNRTLSRIYDLGLTFTFVHHHLPYEFEEKEIAALWA
jgi:hypothetical protein